MKASKVTVKIEMEALSIDCLDGMVTEVLEQVSRGTESGHLSMDDGDQIKWVTERKEVEF